MIDTSTTTWVVDPNYRGLRGQFQVEQVIRWEPAWLSYEEAKDLSNQREVWWLYNFNGEVLGWEDGLPAGAPWRIDMPLVGEYGTHGLVPRPDALTEVEIFLKALGQPAGPPSEFISEIYPWKDQA